VCMGLAYIQRPNSQVDSSLFNVRFDVISGIIILAILNSSSCSCNSSPICWVASLSTWIPHTFAAACSCSPTWFSNNHWRKFERWLRDVVLHGGSDKLKLSKEFTAAHQLLKEDPNQFYLRLFN